MYRYFLEQIFLLLGGCGGEMQLPLLKWLVRLPFFQWILTMLFSTVHLVFMCSVTRTPKVCPGLIVLENCCHTQLELPLCHPCCLIDQGFSNLFHGLGHTVTEMVIHTPNPTNFLLFCCSTNRPQQRLQPHCARPCTHSV